MGRPRILKNKPLLEAIFEARWELQRVPSAGPEFARDPHYKFLLGNFFQKVREKFPHHEELPAASAPEELTPHTVHHRFRLDAKSWPVLQIGPGVLTVNETGNYVWEGFEKLINAMVPTLIEAHPQSKELRFEMLMLRFLNGIALDFTKVDLLAFLSSRMNVNISLPPSIFRDESPSRTPRHLASELAFPCTQPKGTFLLKFATGHRENVPALLFELWFMSRGAEVPTLPDGFAEWATAAHAVVETSFFHLIEGDLEREFSGDS
jgi:uncharacterized protein (TIGR04255 family)